MKKIKTLIIILMVVILSIIFRTASFSATSYYEEIEIEPKSPYEYEEFSITLSGWWATSGYEIEVASHQIVGNQIYVFIKSTNPHQEVLTILTPWTHTENIEKLSKGLYKAYGYVDGSLKVQTIFNIYRNTLEKVYCYPNPFISSQGRKSIIFKGLTGHTSIKIYNIAGELVYEREQDTPLGSCIWSMKNNVASGVYIYIITNDRGKKKTGKIAIIK